MGRSRMLVDGNTHRVNAPHDRSSETNHRPRARALVTGAAVRVGLATAIEFAQRGHDVALAVRTLDERAHRAVESVQQAASAAGHHGIRVELHAADLNDLSAVSALGKAVASNGVDVFAHCAGRYDAQPLGAIDGQYALSHYCVNALAPLLLAQALAPTLATSALPAGGAIVFFTDMHVEGRMYSNHAAYFASKGALQALVGALAVELAPGIRVNGIAPGVIAWPDDADDAFKARYIAKTPLARTGTAAEAARCAAWLALDASYVTGTILRLDGGRWLES